MTAESDAIGNKSKSREIMREALVTSPTLLNHRYPAHDDCGKVPWESDNTYGQAPPCIFFRETLVPNCIGDASLISPPKYLALNVPLPTFPRRHLSYNFFILHFLLLLLVFQYCMSLFISVMSNLLISVISNILQMNTSSKSVLVGL